MRITLLTIGSRGDVQYMLALALGLQQAGYEVCLAADEPFKSLVESHGVPFASTGMDTQTFFQSESGQHYLASGTNPLRAVRAVGYEIKQRVHQVVKSCWEACQGSDAIVTSQFALPIACNMAKRLQVSLIQAYTYPAHPTTALPSPLVPLPFRRSGLLNLLSYQLGYRASWMTIRTAVLAALEQTIGDVPVTNPNEVLQQELPALYAYSPVVLPKPPDWSDSIHVVGYWPLPPDEWTPPKALTEFLSSGPPPLCVGFGSMVSREPEILMEIVLTALKKTGQRGLLVSGWGGLTWPGHSALSDDVLMIDSAPHDWLFPQMAAVVHHGGAGTTAAGLRAGVPTIVAPFFLDQPLWGERVFQLGVGPRPIPQRRLTADRLTNAIQQTVDNRTMQDNVQTLSQRIQVEDGIGQAVGLLTQVLDKHSLHKQSPTALAFPHGFRKAAINDIHSAA